jgi:hypothetical protein
MLGKENHLTYSETLCSWSIRCSCYWKWNHIVKSTLFAYILNLIHYTVHHFLKGNAIIENIVYMANSKKVIRWETLNSKP